MPPIAPNAKPDMKKPHVEKRRVLSLMALVVPIILPATNSDTNVSS
jgi:hypothetical protein